MTWKYPVDRRQQKRTEEPEAKMTITAEMRPNIDEDESKMDKVDFGEDSDEEVKSPEEALKSLKSIRLLEQKDQENEEADNPFAMSNSLVGELPKKHVSKKTTPKNINRQITLSTKTSN